MVSIFWSDMMKVKGSKFLSHKNSNCEEILIRCGEAPGKKYFCPVKIQVVLNFWSDVVKVQGKIFSSHKNTSGAEFIIRCGEAPGKNIFVPKKCNW